MNRQTDRNELTAVLRNVTAAFVAVFVVAASTGVAAQTGNPSPAAKTPASATSGSRVDYIESQRNLVRL
jgi:hypothetical protein